MQAVTAEIETIDSVLAKAYLKLIKINRRIIRNHVVGLVHDMKAGKWVFNGDPIRFDEDGYLTDGQHRLTALIEAGVTLDFLVVRKLSKKAFETIDIGRKRSMPDMLAIEGHKHVHDLASALSYLTRYLRYRNIASHEKITIAEKFQALADHPEIKSLVLAYGTQRYPLKASPGILAATHYLFRQRDPELADTYMGQVTLGENLKEGDAAYTVRRWIIRNHTGKTNSRIGEIVGNVIIRGWNAVRANERLSIIRNRPLTTALKIE